MSQEIQQNQSQQPQVDASYFVGKPKRAVSDATKDKLRQVAKDSPWTKHLSEFRLANPEIKGRDLMKKASESYTKQGKAAKKAAEKAAAKTAEVPVNA